MAVISLSTKVISTLFVSVVGYGIVAGSVIATRKNEGIVERSSAFQQNSHDDKDSKAEEDNEKYSEKENIPSLPSESTNSEDSAEKIEESSPILSEQTDQSQSFSVEIIERNSDISSTNSLTEIKELEQKPTSGKKVTKKQRREEPSLKERIETEIKNKQISLESLYKDGIGNGDLETKGCILVKKGEEIKEENEEEELEITEGRTKEGESHDSCDNQTIWSSVKSEETNGKGFWTRGEESWVKRLVKVNWENLRLAGFTNKDQISDSDDPLNNLKEDLCLSSQTQREGGHWIEISCIFDRKTNLERSN
ncbi:hypothetical protein [Mycoplasma suis]|uniref:Uncharacterized protein n=2 Tax=Mycoplasma suis TaxID=57372 RepID=F0QQ16_MYCSL|nr:hypothetical protein [Mycoplasma suis]ADX97586.1 hypothetical protein MSU_0042 [Mycoplasma suis str. Illinois]CBZ40128.1 hypothetical protein MSUIS_00350 [Mycoplasma suis KI3806]